MINDYTKEQLVKSTMELYNDIDERIMAYVSSKLKHDEKEANRAIWDGFGLLSAIEQQLSCIIDYLEQGDTQKAIENTQGK